MLDFVRAHQLDILLFFSGFCCLLVILVLLTESLSPKRKAILAMTGSAAMLLMLADRSAYIYRGDASQTGWWMVRISNFLVFFLTLAIIYGITLYLIDVSTRSGQLTRIPRRLQACRALFAVGVALLIISQFTGLYYTFDDQNRYQRSTWLPLSYAAPLLMAVLQQSIVIQYRKLMSRRIFFSLMLNTFIPFIASVVQLYVYGISLTNMTMGGLVTALYVFELMDLNATLKSARRHEIESLEAEQKKQHALFEQTAEALVNAIDAKDQYTRGHSNRVARYSVMIAEKAGKTQAEIEEIYYAALLHDVGKIGVPDHIINKVGKLTDEEYAQMKMHPVYGNNILSKIQQLPNFSIGAKYHHERYDGRGYPEGLKGGDIPEIARIIGVADAYDAMTSKRSYRNSIPQHLVREELVKGTGTQFDPEFARIMISLVDHDVNYDMQDHYEGVDSTIDNPVQKSTKFSEILDGILINDKVTRVRLVCRLESGFTHGENLPQMIVFDALDGRIHEDAPSQKSLLYFEYGRIRFDGETESGNVRKIQTDVRVNGAHGPAAKASSRNTVTYDIDMMRFKDHAMVRIGDGTRTVESILALPDSARFTYAAFRGEHCVIKNISAERDEVAIGAETIPRIAKEISFIDDCPQGDIPNIQIDSWRMNATEGIPLTGNLKLTFHTRSLPTARLIWHCPFISVFTAKDGRVNGEDFREFILLRLDGENWESDEHAQNSIRVDHSMAFEGWNVWKEKHRAGLDCEVHIRREGNTVSIQTEILGVLIIGETRILDDIDDVYIAITGDQCAITNIRITPED